MAWERGFVVCDSKVSDRIGSQLEAQSVHVKLVSRGGETAFVFAGRVTPVFDTDSCFVCSVDGQNSGYSHSKMIAYRPYHLVPKLGLTFGITLERSFADQHGGATDLAALWLTLGPESECEIAEGLTTFRWDLDDCELEDPQVQSRTESLKAISRWLEDRRIPHRIVLFDKGWPEVLGDLPEVDDVFAGPATCLTLQWQSQEGDTSSVVANDAEFMADGDDIPNSPLWAL